MARFLAAKLFRAFLTLFLVVTFVFVVLRLSGDPALLILGPEAPPEAIAAFRRAWSLDDPLWQQFLRYVANVAAGDFGLSMRDRRPAAEIVLELLGQPYIRTATAKGAPWYRVVNWHALPNAAIPTVTVIGFMIGSLIAGAVVTESVFAWPGIGRQLVVSVANRDLAVVQVVL